jgi:hypothetical protein
MATKKLSSCCKCGPKGTAKHEMGQCPELFVGPHMEKRQEEKNQLFGIRYSVQATPIVTGEKRIKPPWES